MSVRKIEKFEVHCEYLESHWNCGDVALHGDTDAKRLFVSAGLADEQLVAQKENCVGAHAAQAVRITPLNEY